MYMQTSNETFLNWIKDGMSLKVYVQCTCLYIICYVKFRGEDIFHFFTTSLKGKTQGWLDLAKDPTKWILK